MKKMKFAFVIAVAIMGINSVKAVDISTEDYNRLRLVFSEARIDAMTEEEVEKFLAYDLENAENETVYYKGISKNNESYTWKEISEEEYTSEYNIESYSTSYSTNYKQIGISTIYNDSDQMYSFYLLAKWKAAPSVRSFDVIAMRFNNIALISGSQTGVQAFKKVGNTNYDTVTYSPNGTNIVKKSNGFGISMNLVDDAINALELSIDAMGIKSGSNSHVWGSYQHAVENVTLAQSQNYNISSAGYGGVINFAASLKDTYDGMHGVDQAL